LTTECPIRFVFCWTVVEHVNSLSTNSGISRGSYFTCVRSAG